MGSLADEESLIQEKAAVFTNAVEASTLLSSSAKER